MSQKHYKCDVACKVIDLGHFGFLGHYQNIYMTKRKSSHGYNATLQKRYIILFSG